jgi:uncharacterized membrane protein
MKNEANKPPTWFWVVSVLALLWNLIGASAYLQQAFMTIDDLAKMSQEERFLFESQPAWVTGSFAVAVWGGLLASLFLLARKKWAYTLFIISLLGLLAQQTYIYFLSNSLEVYGTAGLFMPVVILILAIYLVLFSKKAADKQWIR